jgi:hypothetical protein
MVSTNKKLNLCTFWCPFDIVVGAIVVLLSIPSLSSSLLTEKTMSNCSPIAKFSAESSDKFSRISTRPFRFCCQNFESNTLLLTFISETYPLKTDQFLKFKEFWAIFEDVFIKLKSGIIWNIFCSKSTKISFRPVLKCRSRFLRITPVFRKLKIAWYFFDILGNYITFNWLQCLITPLIYCTYMIIIKYW